MASDKEKIEETLQQLLLQLDELREAIRLVQSRSLAIASEIQEIRMAYETLSNIQKASEKTVLAALDRNGYVFIKVQILSSDEATVRISRDYYATVPIESAKKILIEYEKELTESLKYTEAELKRLNSIYEQLQRKIQEYVAALQRAEEVKK
jgi:prefoldin alpha subunit